MRSYPARTTAAHPRSRGENPSVDCTAPNADGSSPLTRGKLVPAHLGAVGLRLIPAHAGKTRHAPPTAPPHAAHPRSRGENSDITVTAVAATGSSPLTRGKRRRACVRVWTQRLIPAHAGKTAPYGPATTPESAHPRSRGENPRGCQARSPRIGSSPLTRGKRARCPGLHAWSGLIPAHAGKTHPRPPALRVWWAHPRSRGENSLIR